MEIIADLQLHSRFARAVSRKMNLSEIARHTARKGIGLVATGDWQHPLWFSEIEQELEEVRPGIYHLRELPEGVEKAAEYLLVSELSCIYRRGGRGRRVHHLIFSPSLEACRKMIKELQKRGANLEADGRPIIGLSSYELLKLLLDTDPRFFLIPAHVWTPWFGLFGERSGYNSLEECFADLTPHIRAVETGLSSDPAMNWLIPELQERTLVSFSDAHSGPKIGREATVLQLPEEFSYQDVREALEGTSTTNTVRYTLEYYPEEGKYHWSGHRSCGVRVSPEEERRLQGKCPVCGRPLTRGVASRVSELAGTTEEHAPVVEKKQPGGAIFLQSAQGIGAPFVSLVPLLELLQLILGSPTKSEREYQRLTGHVPEFTLLLQSTRQELTELGGEALAEAIHAVRERNVQVSPGYDGVFGTVTLPGK